MAELKPVGHGNPDASSARKATREIYSREWGQTETWPIYDRALLLAGNRIGGPAIVEEPSATTVLERGDRLEVDALGNLVIEL